MDQAGNDNLLQHLWTADKPTTVTDMYGDLSTLYDKFAEDQDYVAPMVLAKALAGFYPKEHQTVKVLDIGAGTGLLGVELEKLGFRTVDGLDPSQPMLDLARATHVYSNLFCQYFTAKPTPGIDKDSYDVIVSSGSLIQNHLPTDCLIEAARIVRPGGIICMITRTGGPGCFNESDYGDQFKAVSKKLEEERKIVEIQWEEVNYYDTSNGIVMAYRVLQ